MTAVETPKRLISLDAFRGATIAGMILVNNPGTWSAVYPQLRHAAWHGWTFTDWIFPFFLWIVGVAMTFSFAKRVEAGGAKGKLVVHVLRRSAIIFALGLFLAGFPFGLFLDHHFSWDTIRIPGVLQRIAICYLFGSVIYLYTGLRGQILWLIGLLGGYWLLMAFVPVPGYGSGLYDPVGNLCWWVDTQVLAGHTWRGSPVPGFDPEGVVSTLPAIATVLFGALTGRWLRTERSREEKTVWMFVIGNALLLLGAILDMWIPINKQLWTTSYSIFMAGWALDCLAIFYWFIDVKGYTKWATPFVIYGMNAIAVYVLSGIVARLLGLIKMTMLDGSSASLQSYIFQSFFIPLASPINASLLFGICFVLALFIVAWFMWKRKWFLKV
jgi:predicted acyltransferase